MATDLYGPLGSVPKQTDLGGSGGRPFGVRATPDDFGAQIGKGVEKIGTESAEVTDHFGGMILETAANEAEVNYTKAAGALHAKYSQYEGLQAQAMRPQYESELQAIRDQYAQNLPLKAQHAYNISTERSMVAQTSNYNEYAANQVKDANIKSQDSLMDASVAKTGDLNVVLNDQQFGEQVLAPIVHGGNALADVHGNAALATGINPETGSYSYPDTPEGKAAEASHLAVTNGKLATAYLTAAKTVADNSGASAAADWAKKHWDMMPDAAKVQMNQYLAPKMKNEFISGNIVTQSADLDAGWTQNLLSNVPGSPSEQINQNPLAVIRRSEGYTGRVGKDSNGYDVINGINAKYFPEQVKELDNIYKTQGKAAGEKYADDFYQKNFIDKYNIASLPGNAQAIVADALVNSGGDGDFSKSLIAAAKSGASPLELIDMRRKEYQRLNDTGKEEYTSSFKRWINRLDNLQEQQLGGGNNVYPSKVDYLRAKEEDFVQKNVEEYLNHYNDDYYGSQIQERRARTYIQHQISQEEGALKSDQNIISNAINGSLTKGKPPATYEELRAIPGMAPILDKTMQQQGKFFGTIDTMIAKANHDNPNVNSANGYDAILNALDESGNFTRQSRIDYLSKGLGSTNAGYSISMKDFNDAKPAIDLDPALKRALTDNMKAIATANGNLDGKGSQRAIAWYNQAMEAWKQSSVKGMTPTEFSESLGQKQGPPIPAPPSRMQQIENWASDLFKNKNTTVMVMSPDGRMGTIPAENLDKALAAGYKKAQ